MVDTTIISVLSSDLDLVYAIRDQMIRDHLFYNPHKQIIGVEEVYSSPDDRTKWYGFESYCRLLDPEQGNQKFYFEDFMKTYARMLGAAGSVYVHTDSSEIQEDVEEYFMYTISKKFRITRDEKYPLKAFRTAYGDSFLWALDILRQSPVPFNEENVKRYRMEWFPDWAQKDKEEEERKKAQREFENRDDQVFLRYTTLIRNQYDTEELIPNALSIKYFLPGKPASYCLADAIAEADQIVIKDHLFYCHPLTNDYKGKYGPGLCNYDLPIWTLHEIDANRLRQLIEFAGGHVLERYESEYADYWIRREILPEYSKEADEWYKKADHNPMDNLRYYKIKVKDVPSYGILSLLKALSSAPFVPEEQRSNSEELLERKTEIRKMKEAANTANRGNAAGTMDEIRTMVRRRGAPFHTMEDALASGELAALLNKHGYRDLWHFADIMSCSFDIMDPEQYFIEQSVIGTRRDFSAGIDILPDSLLLDEDDW